MKKAVDQVKSVSNSNIFQHIHFEYVLLAVFFLLALILRTYKLGTLLTGFHVDELDVGYVGRYILLHGRDFFGQILPLTFNKFGDFRPTGIFYLSGLSTFIFGVNEFAVRFPSALFGALTVFPLYGLSKKISGQKTVGLIAAFILAANPWHLVLSRATSESIIGLFFLLTGLWIVTVATDKRSKKFLLVGIVSLFLPYLFYHSFRLLIPFFVGIFAWVSEQSPFKKWLFVATGFFFLVTIAYGVSPSGTGRFGQVAFYKNPDTLSHTFSVLPIDTSKPTYVLKEVHNVAVLWGREFVRQYGAYVSFQFLFLSGGYPERYVVPEVGLIQLTLLPMLLLGIFFCLREKKYTPLRLFMVFAFLLSPIPAALTYEDAPNVQRSMILMFPLIFFIALGIQTVGAFVSKQKILLVAAGLLYLAVFGYETRLFWNLYTLRADMNKSLLRNDGNRKLFTQIKTNYSSYDTIYLPVYEESPMYASFYFNKFDSFPGDIYRSSPGVTKIDKFTFLPMECPTKQATPSAGKRILYVNLDHCPEPEQLKKLPLITRSDGTTAYALYETE
jgi:4-amino-4-deoxy-L-arabinose transferase-like glycosyltransferase